MSELFEKLLKKRGIERDFLYPKYEDMIDPFLLPDMQKMIDRIRQAVERDERILIFGDYDADGVTSSTIMRETLILALMQAYPEKTREECKQQIHVMLPNRFTDGYGMSKRILPYVKKKKIPLVITVDCGSNNHEIIQELVETKIDVLVTDHHECKDELPVALAVVNPKRKDWIETGENSSNSEDNLTSIDGNTGGKNIQKKLALRDLCGAGVAFKIAQAFVQEKMIRKGQEKWLLDLAMIGTICDSMPMSIENRRICYFGMKVLEKTRRPGLKALLKVAGVRRFGGEAVGFQIGPRINAAGRMESPDLAFDLLNTDSRVEAANLAEELNNLNTLRRESQQAAVREISDQNLDENPVMVVCGKWHEGVLGIIAGKLVEKYQKPAFVLAEVEQEIINEKNEKIKQIILKGSGRSFGEYNLAEALKYAENTIIGGGGHAEACGVKIEQNQLEEFREKVNEFYQNLKLKNQEKFLEISPDLYIENISNLTLEFVEELRALEPFASNNSEPIFCLSNMRVLDSSRLGQQQNHLRLQIMDAQDHELKLMQFSAPERNLRLQSGAEISVNLSLVENEFRGVHSVEGRIIKIDLI